MDVKDLSPNPKNPRKITESKNAMLAKTLSEFGDLGGIVYNRQTKRLVGGHQRTNQFDRDAKITIEKKYPKPTKVGTVAEGFITHKGEKFRYREVSWDEIKEKAASIAANKSAGEWDMGALGEWMRDLSDFALDLDLTMFDETERSDLFPDTIKVDGYTRTGPTGVDEDSVPDDVPAKTKAGDLIILGNHRLLCGDATSIESYKRLIGEREVSLVYTDPPYGIAIQNSQGSVGSGKLAKIGKYKKFEGDLDTKAAFKAYEIFKKLGAKLCVWGANYFTDFLPPSMGWIVWDKRGDMASNNFADCELAWTNLNKAARCYKQLWSGMIREGEREKRVHPTQKPTQLAVMSFEQLDPEGGTVLDVFGGSGSTMIACEKVNRSCLMMELDPHYCDVIIARWEAFTGKKAQKAKLVKKQ